MVSIVSVVSSKDKHFLIGKLGNDFSIHTPRTSVFDFLERSVDLGLLDLRRVGIEAAEFLRFLPGHDAVGAGFIVFGAHVVLFDGRGVGVVWASAWWAGVDYLVGRTVVSIVWFWFWF